MVNEFQSLYKLAQKNGNTDTQISSFVTKSLAQEFEASYPIHPPIIRIEVNFETGDVAFLSGTKDITPKEFSSKAQLVIRTSLLELIENEKKSRISAEDIQPNLIPSKLEKLLKTKLPVGSMLFYTFNIIAALITIVNLFALFDSQNWNGFYNWYSNLSVLRAFASIVLGIIPFLFIIIRLYGVLEKKSKLFNSLVVLTEIPLFVVFSSVVFIETILPLPVYYIAGMIFTIFCTYNLQKFSKNPLLTQLEHMVNVIAVMFILYLTLIGIFYLPILAIVLFSQTSEIFYNFNQLLRSISWGWYNQSNSNLMYGKMINYNRPPTFYNFFGTLLMILFNLIILFASVLPVFIFLALIVYLYSKARSSFVVMKTTYSKSHAHALTLAASGLFICSLVILPLLQPRTVRKALTTLTSSNESYEDKIKAVLFLQDKQDEAKRATNFNYDMMYPIGAGFVYENFLGYPATNNPVFKITSKIYTALTYPLLDHSGRSTPSYILNQGYNLAFPTESKPYLAPTTLGNVTISSRKITAIPDPTALFAQVSVEDTFTNLVQTDQEATYDFTLPESAAITELLLGPDLEFPGVVSPKGAARQVYEQEVNRRKDPALIEQLGISTYRLRVFPIPGASTPKPMRVKFTYSVPAQLNGYPLPLFSSEKNIRSTNQTRIFLNSTEVSPNTLASTIANNEIAQSLLTLCTSQRQLTVVSIPLSLTANPRYCLDNPVVNQVKGKKIRIVLETTDTGSQSRTALAELALLIKKNANFFQNNNVELILTSTNSFSKPISIKNEQDLPNITAFGASNVAHLFNAPLDKVDAAIFVTESLNGLSGVTTLQHLPSHLAIVSNQHETQPLPESAISVFLASRIHYFPSISDAINTIEPSLAYTSLDNMIFATPLLRLDSPQTNAFTLQLVQSISATEERIVTPLVMKGVINNLFKDFQTRGLEIKDLTNTIAKKFNIVTPFSSLIALVNDEQKSALQRAETGYNRYTIAEDYSFKSQPIGNIQPNSFRSGEISLPTFNSFDMGTTFSGDGMQPIALSPGNFKSSNLLLGSGISFIGGVITFVLGIISIIYLVKKAKLNMRKNK